MRASAIILEKKRREREERLRFWEPTGRPGNDQRGFIASHAKIRAVFGGNRSGKTEVGVADGLLFALGRHPVRSANRKPPVFIRYCAPKYIDGIKSVILKKIQSLVPRHELKGGSWAEAWSERDRTLSFENGSLIRFFSYEQDINVYGGDDIDAFYMDEHAPEKYFIENVARTVDRNGYGVLTMTPEAGITWEEEKIIEASEGDPQIDYWFFDTYNNPHLSQEGIKELEKLITDERLRDAKLHGRFVALAGLVLPQFNKAIHVIPDRDIDPHWYRQFIIDPHLRKPSYMCWLAWDRDGHAFVYREAEFAPSDGGVPELAAFIRTKSSGDKIEQWIGDEAMGGDGKNIFGESSVLVSLRNQGIPVVGTNQESSKSFASGINKMRTFLTADPVSGKPRLYWFESCRKGWKQTQNYQFRTETKADEEMLREHVRNVEDEGPTCVRYAVMAEPDQRPQTGGPRIVLPGKRRMFV